MIGVRSWTPAAYDVREGSCWCIDVRAVSNECSIAHIELGAVPEFTVCIVWSFDDVAVSCDTKVTSMVSGGWEGVISRPSERLGQASVVVVFTKSWNNSCGTEC